MYYWRYEHPSESQTRTGSARPAQQHDVMTTNLSYQDRERWGEAAWHLGLDIKVDRALLMLEARMKHLMDQPTGDAVIGLALGRL